MSTRGADREPNERMVDRPFPPSVIYLLGAPAVGKYTVAKAIAERNGAVVVDNQLINQPIFSLLSEFPDPEATKRMWEEIEIIRGAVLRMIEHVVPRSTSYVLTNALENAPEDHDLYEQIKGIATRRGSVFLPVILTCEIEEELRRVSDPSRTQRLKIDDPVRARAYIEATTFYFRRDGDPLTIDTTSNDPGVTAELILAKLSDS